MSVSLEECLSKEAVERLRDERIDAAFVRAAVADAQGLTVHPLLEEPMVVALPSVHGSRAGSPRWAALLAGVGRRGLHPVPPASGPGLLDATVAACLRAGFSPRLGQEAPRITSTLGLVSAGLGVALVPASMRRVRVDGVAYRRLIPGERPTAVLNLVLRRGEPSAVARNFSDLVRRAARGNQEAEGPAD